MKRFKKHKNNIKGFTLIEMIVVVAVISVLMVASIDIFANMYSLSVKTNDSRVVLQEARYALDTISREVRESSSFIPTSSPGTNGSTIDIINKQGQNVRFSFVCTANCNTSNEYGRIAMDVTKTDGSHEPLRYLTSDKVEAIQFYIRPIEISSETSGINKRDTASGYVYHPFSNLRIQVRGKVTDRTNKAQVVTLDTALTRSIYSDYSYCQLFPCGNFKLTVAKAGAGTGSVSSNPAGITDTNLSKIFKEGDTVEVTAFNYTGAAIWTGCDSVAGSVCTVNVSSDKTVTVTFDPFPYSDFIQIGTQWWSRKNLNVGTRINGGVSQANDGVVRKYCYGNVEANCTSQGGLYQWSEAMGYSTTAGAQGICTAGSHIPTDNDWKILEMYLGMTQAQADALAFRGTDQGTKLKSGGTSGFEALMPGFWNSGTSVFQLQNSMTYIWTSNQFDASTAYSRYLAPTHPTVGRNTHPKNGGFSVRCVKD